MCLHSCLKLIYNPIIIGQQPSQARRARSTGTAGRSVPKSVAFRGAGVIHRESPVPFYFQLGTYIEERVKSGEWRPDQFLPSEQDLCESLGISRTVVRQALDYLERKGLVTKRNGKRTRVAYRKYEGGLMQNLRGFHEDVAARGRKTSTKVLAFEVIPASAEVAEALNLREGDAVLMLNRLRYLDGKPEVLVVTYLPERLCSALAGEDFSNQSLYETLTRKCGLTIVSGSRTIEAVALNRTDGRLLDAKAGSPALLIRSIGLLADLTPLEYFVARYPGDRTKFHAQLVS